MFKECIILKNEREVKMKKQMNIFIPYDKNNEHHEDHLTRGFFLLLKYSPSIFYMFYDYVKEQFDNQKKQKEVSEEIESVYTTELNYSLNTQIGCTKAKELLNSKILSILITDKNLQIGKNIQCSDRTAIYDGVISLNDEWTFIIENKPNCKNVWENPLDIGLILGNEITEKNYFLVNFPVVLTWREIFKRLDNIKCNDTEKIMIKDFKAFVFENYPTLFPYDTFRQCGKNRELLDLKIERLLKSIVNDEEHVQYHNNWANKIVLNEACINQVDYKPLPEHDCIAIYFSFGSNIPKSKALFSNIDIEKLYSLKGYDIRLFVGIKDTHGRTVYTIPCVENKEKEFITFWQNNLSLLKERQINDFWQLQNDFNRYDFLEKMDLEEIKNKIGNRSVIRVNVGIDIEYNLKFEEIYKLEANNNLTDKIIEITRNCLQIANQDTIFNQIISQ